MSSAVACMIYCFTLAQVVVHITASRRHCSESRVTVDGHSEVKVDCTAAQLSTIPTGAFPDSNFSNLRSINLCWNRWASYQEAIASLVQIQNTKIDTVILDKITMWKYGFNVLSMSDFCSPFGSKIRRLSLKDNNIVAVDFKNVECLADLREVDLSFCLVLSVYWPTLLVESNGQGWVRMLLGC